MPLRSSLPFLNAASLCLRWSKTGLPVVLLLLCSIHPLCLFEPVLFFFFFLGCPELQSFASISVCNIKPPLSIR